MGLQELLESISNLRKSGIRNLVDARLKEFEENGKKPNNELFKELCFCILAANFSAERSMIIQQKIGNGFLTLPKSRLAEKLRLLGYRFPNTRAEYITEARKHKDTLKDVINSFGASDDLREWLAQNVKGIGYKESSHFLRNIGYNGFAILDFHIIDILVRCGLIEKPKTLTKRKYLAIEDMLRKIAGRARLRLGELDLYLWYLETQKVLK